MGRALSVLAHRMVREGILFDGVDKQIFTFQEKLADRSMKKRQERPQVQQQKQLISGYSGLLVRPAAITGHKTESLWESYATNPLMKSQQVLLLGGVRDAWRSVYLAAKGFKNPQHRLQIQELRVFAETMLFLFSVPGNEFEADEEYEIQSVAKITKSTGKLVKDDGTLSYVSCESENQKTAFTAMLDDAIKCTLGFSGIHATVTLNLTLAGHVQALIAFHNRFAEEGWTDASSRAITDWRNQLH